MAQLNPATVTPGRELEPREHVDSHGVGMRLPHVTYGNLGSDAIKYPAHPVTELGDVGSRDLAADCESDCLRPWDSHRN
jgi:hypothetical protein